MGTLTADCPRLAEHCPHKLPSSCRLTSTPNCCACADERPHSLTYRVYIDGVGFVQRGTRWQSYCWFCKSFWDARVAAVGLMPADTRIPEDPDQTEFVERWFEFHQGYRTVIGEDGREERVPLEAEPLKDADPGHLPRTLEELQSGQIFVLASDNRRREQPENVESAPHVSVEDALDQMLEEVDDEDGETTPTSNSPMNTSRPDLHPQDAAQNAQATQEARTRLDEAYAEAQAAVESVQRVRDRAEARLNNANSELLIAQERLRRIRRQQITAGNFARVFGTREDVQSEDYVSPITSMFVRQAQWGRQMAERQRVIREQETMLRNFEEVQRQINGEAPGNTTPASPPPAPIEQSQPISFQPQYIGDSHTFVHAPIPPQTTSGNEQTTSQPGSEISQNPSWDEYLARFQEYMSPEEMTELRAMLVETFASPREAARTNALRSNLEPEQPLFAGLDGDSRPEPKKEEAMHFKLECKICLQQIADTACLPCGHLSMCEWCADQWVPTKPEDKTRPRDKGVRCPCCRARVKSRVKIYVG